MTKRIVYYSTLDKERINQLLDYFNIEHNRKDNLLTLKSLIRAKLGAVRLWIDGKNLMFIEGKPVFETIGEKVDEKYKEMIILRAVDTMSSATAAAKTQSNNIDKEDDELVEKMELENSAVKIQSQYKGFKTRKSIKEAWKDPQEVDETPNKIKTKHVDPKENTDKVEMDEHDIRDELRKCMNPIDFFNKVYGLRDGNPTEEQIREVEKHDHSDLKHRPDKVTVKPIHPKTTVVEQIKHVIQRNNKPPWWKIEAKHTDINKSNPNSVGSIKLNNLVNQQSKPWFMQ